MRGKGAKDVPKPWGSDPNLPQMFSAVCGQWKTKTMGITSFRDEIRTGVNEKRWGEFEVPRRNV